MEEDTKSASCVEQPPLKRLRGGGNSNDDNNNDNIPYGNNNMEDMIEDDDICIEEEFESYKYNGNGSDPPQPIPEEYDNDSGLTAKDLEMQSKWARPRVDPKFDPNCCDLDVQWMDMDMTVGPPLVENPHKGKKVVGMTQNPIVPIIRIYGVNDLGNSVMMLVHGFIPYAYFSIPADCPLMQSHNHKESSSQSPEHKQRHLHEIRTRLDSRLQQAVQRSGDPFKGHQNHNNNHNMPPKYCVGVQLVTDQSSIMGYDTKDKQFIKVILAMPTLIPTLKRLMEEGNDMVIDSIMPSGGGRDASNSGGYGNEGNACTWAPFECNVPFVLRYMIDRKVVGSGWLTLPKGTYKVLTGHEKSSHTQLEVVVSYTDVVSHASEGKWSRMAPIRILSTDIECQGRKGHFPEAQCDPVIQIGNVVFVYGQPKPIVQNVFTLKGCLPIVGAQVLCSDEEADMLLKWRAFVQAVDPDMITGYNVQNFDIPYLLDRATALGKKHPSQHKKLEQFRMWGRIRNQPAKMKETTFQSAAFGKRNNVETQIDGRVIFDMLPYMQRNHKLSSYTLNSVCAEFLKQQKEDVHHSIISDLQNGSDEDRHRLATYCLKDSQLPYRLMEKLSVLINYVEMARVTGVPIEFLISRGQQIKVFSMLLRKCADVNLLVPTLNKKGFNNDDTYEGATVLDPIKAYYEIPIATLDFASLYPSIMQAWNLCYSTLVPPSDVHTLDPKIYEKSDNGHVFVRSSQKKGILPIILQELLTARKRAKKDMKNAPTEFEKAVQNGRQVRVMTLCVWQNCTVMDSLLCSLPCLRLTDLLLFLCSFPPYYVAGSQSIRELGVWIYRCHRGTIALSAHCVLHHFVWTSIVGKNQGLRRRKLHDCQWVRPRCPGHLRGHGFRHGQVWDHYCEGNVSLGD
jgi:DNA polymerase delta subunit 1